MRAYEINVKGRDWAKTVRAENEGKAKYQYFLGVRDAWPDVTFRDLTCHALTSIPATKQEIAEREADAFNRLVPVGTMVRYWSGVREGEPTGTGRIYHPATVVCDHASAWIEGARSCHSITHVEVVTQ